MREASEGQEPASPDEGGSGPSGEPRPALVVVAHPDDETLWAGGTLMARRDLRWYVVTLCRGHDPDRAPRFGDALLRLGAVGVMGDADDGPEQRPLGAEQVRDVLAELLPAAAMGLVLTHGPRGEYTRHRRHEETCRAVVELWATGRLRTTELWMFAYADGGGGHAPTPRADAHLRVPLSPRLLADKRGIITELYGFARDSWEARAVTDVEAFHRFHGPEEARLWISREEGSP